MNRIVHILTVTILSIAPAAFGQALPTIPSMTAAAYFSSDGTGGAGTWNPATSTGGVTPIKNVPPATGVYYSNDGTGNAGTWVPCTAACFSGGGTGGAAFPATNGLVYNTSTTASRNATASDVSALGPLTNNTSGKAATAGVADSANAVAASGVTGTLAQTQGGTGINTVVGGGPYLYWDSYGAGTGASDIRNSAFGMLSRDVPAPAHNYAIAGTNFQSIQASVFANSASLENFVTPIVNTEGGGENDNCSGTPCTTSVKQIRMADWTRMMTDGRSRVNASTCAKTGTWTNDTTSVGVPTGQVSWGYPITNTTGTGTVTCTIPSSTSPVLFITARVASASTAVYGVTVDGTAVVDAGSGTTSFSAAPIASSGLSGTSFFYTQAYTVTPNQSHTVVFTVTSGSGTEPVSVTVVPPLAQQNYLGIFSQISVGGFSSGAAVFNPITAALITQLQGFGFARLVLVDAVSGNNGTSNTGWSNAADVSSTEQTPYAGASAANHPNDLGNVHIYMTAVNAFKAAGFNIFGGNLGGKNTELERGSITPFIFSPPNVGTSGSLNSLGQTFQQWGSSGYLDYIGGNLLGANSFFQHAADATKPWGNVFMRSTWTGSNGAFNFWTCFNARSSTMIALTAAFTSPVVNAAGGCFDPSSNGYLNFAVQPIGTAIASATTIAPTTPIVHITGSTPVATIVPVSGVSTFSGYGTSLYTYTDAAESFTAAGNIAYAFSTNAGQLVMWSYDPSTAKWTPNVPNPATAVYSATQFIATGTAPTIAAGAAAGTSPTVSITAGGNNQDHVVNVTTGTATTTGVLATVTFSATLGTAPQGCQLTPNSANTPPAATAVWAGTPTTTTWVLNTITALNASTAYKWNVHCQ